MGDILYQELWGASGPQYGPWFGGMVLSTFLYGITCAHMMYYFWHHAQDPMWMRSMVAALWELDTVVLLFSITIFWCYIIITNPAVDGMASTSVVTLVGISLSTEFILACIIVLIVQCYYISTLSTITSRRTWYTRSLTCMLYVLATGAFAIGAVNVYYAIHTSPETVPGYGVPSVDSLYSNSYLYTVPPIIQMALNFLTDTIITVSLCLSISRKHSILEPDPILIKLSQYFVNRGILTTAIQLVQMVIYIVDQFAPLDEYTNYEYLWIALYFIESKIYVNSFLALLNARGHLREMGEVRELQIRERYTNNTPAGDSSLIQVPGRRSIAWHRLQGPIQIQRTRPRGSAELFRDERIEDCSKSVLIIE